jgi:hypothetical protein
MRSITSHPLFLSSALAAICCLSAKGQPSVVSADPRGDYLSVKVIYSTAMDPASTTNLANYALTNNASSAPVSITGASLSTDQTNVVLHLASLLQVTTNYTLTISNVKDAGLSTISPNPTIISFYFGGPPGGISWNFNDGLVPVNTFLATTSPGLDTFNGTNPTNSFEAITNAGGFNNSGCLILVSNTTGQTYGQWHLTNVYTLAGGQPVTNVHLAFKFWMVNFDPGFSLAANTIGNGLIFHIGPEVPQQYTGGASSWGNGLDLTFRNFANGIIPQGVDIFWLAPYTEDPTSAWHRNQDGAGPGFTIPSVTPFPTGMEVYSTNWAHPAAPIIAAFVDTNGIGGGLTGFSNYIAVDYSVSNGVINVTCGNANLGSVLLFSNLTLASWTPIIGGSSGSGLPASFDFTATDGAGNHQQVIIDDVDLSVNGTHIPGSGVTTNQLGSVQITGGPVSVSTNENTYATFSVSTIGAVPQTYQWYSNGVAIAGANAASYKTPLTLFSTMNGTLYSVVVSNDFSSATSTNALLTIIPDTVGAHVVSVGSIDGNSIGVLFDAYIDAASAGNAANYAVSGTTVTAADARTNLFNFGDPVANYTPSYLKTVRLTLSSPVSSGYTVTVKSNVLSRTGVMRPYNTNLIGAVVNLADEVLGTGGMDPTNNGETFSAATSQIQIMASGSDMMAIAAGGTADHGNWAYLQRNGNFDMIADATWETRTASSAKCGMMVRTTLSDPGSPALSELLFPAAPGRNTYETAIRTSDGGVPVSWAAAGQPGNGNRGASWPNSWLRIRRVGPTFYGFTSSDGNTWLLLAQATPDTNVFPFAGLYIGLAATAANNSGAFNEADFASWGPLSYPGAVVSINPNLKASYTNAENGKQTFSIGASVSGNPNLLSSDIAFQWQRAEPGAPTVFNDILDGTGNSNIFTTPFLTVANDNGAKFRCVAYVGDLTTGHSTTSIVATLTVVVDTVPPYMISAAADASFQKINIFFDGPIDGSSVGSATYSLVPLGGGPAIASDGPTGLTSGGDTIGVSLAYTTTNLVSGVKYTLTVSGIKDLAGNLIDATTVPGGKSRTVSAWVLARGYLKYERYFGPTYPGGAGTSGSVATLLNNPNFPDSPDLTELITYSGYPNGDVNNVTVDLVDFGARISGFFIPPTNGVYLIYVRGNDGTCLYINTNANDTVRANLQWIGDENIGYAAPGASWYFGATNSTPINAQFPVGTNAVPLQGGTNYYLECLEQQNTGTSWAEFTWGNNGITVLDGSSVTNVAGGAYAPGRGAGATTAPGRGGAPTNTYNITGTNIAVFVNPDASIIQATGPGSLTVTQFQTASFAVFVTNAQISAGGTPSKVTVSSFQWLKNGIPIAGATNSFYFTPPAAYPGDNGATFGCVMSVAGLPFMTITNSATLTVIQDTDLPTVVSASSLGGTTIGIRYSEPMDPATTTNTANYTSVTGGSGLTVTKVQLRPDGQTVLLTLSGTLTAATFSVTINNVTDMGLNTIAVNTIASGNVIFTQMTASDIGVATTAAPPSVVQTNGTLTTVTFDLNYRGSTVMPADNVFETVASGNDIGTNQDGFHYVYEQRSGDFDVMVHVERIDGSSANAKAGLMMRESLAPGSRNYAIVVEPQATNAADGLGLGFNGVEIRRRTTNNLATIGFANNPNPPVLGNYGFGFTPTNMYPCWLRMRRTGNSVYVYTGADGTNWYLCGRETSTTTGGVPWPTTVYLGLATSARTNSIYTQSRFTQYRNFIAPARQQVLLVGMDNSVAGTAPYDTPAGNPNGPGRWFSADLYMYNLFVGLGYNVVVVQDSTARAEDATGMSLVFWDGTSSSSNLGGTPSTFTYVPVPVVQAKDATLEKEGWVKNAGDRNHFLQTTVRILNTNNPIVKGLYQSNQLVQVNSSAQYFTYAAYTNLPVPTFGLSTNFIVVAASTTNNFQATIYYANPSTNGGLWLSPSNIAHRRVGLWLGDNGGNPAGDFTTVTSDGSTLLLNAIAWAIATNEPPTIATQPANQAVPVGQSATFSVVPAGPGPYTLQWRKISGGTTNNVGGATNLTYYTPATVAGDDGTQFQVVVTGLYGSVTSAVATLFIVQPISNVNLTPLAPSIPSAATVLFSVTVTNIATNGNTTITYRWYQTNNLSATHAVVTNGDTYTSVALFAINNGNTFYVSASNAANVVTSATATVTVPQGQARFGPPLVANGTNLTVTWTNGGILLAATNVAGPYSPIATSGASPASFTITNTPSKPQQFFRVQQ